MATIADKPFRGFFSFCAFVAAFAALSGCSKKNEEVIEIASTDAVTAEENDDVDSQKESTSKLALTSSEKDVLFAALKSDADLNATVKEPATINDVLSYFPFSKIVAAKITTQSDGHVDIEFLNSSGAKVKTPQTFLGGAAKGFVADGILILNLKTKVSRVFVTVFIDLNANAKVSGLSGSGLVSLSADAIHTGVPIYAKCTDQNNAAVDCQILRESGKVIARALD